jgi:hypothetical protein
VEDETIKGLIELLLLETQAKGRNGKAYVSSLLSALSAHYIQNYSNYRDLQDASAKSVKIGKSQMRISVNPIGRFGFIRSLFHLLFRPCQFYLK